VARAKRCAGVVRPAARRVERSDTDTPRKRASSLHRVVGAAGTATAETSSPGAGTGSPTARRRPRRTARHRRHPERRRRPPTPRPCHRRTPTRIAGGPRPGRSDRRGVFAGSVPRRDGAAPHSAAQVGVRCCRGIPRRWRLGRVDRHPGRAIPVDRAHDDRGARRRATERGCRIGNRWAVQVTPGSTRPVVTTARSVGAPRADRHGARGRLS